MLSTHVHNRTNLYVLIGMSSGYIHVHVMYIYIVLISKDLILLTLYDWYSETMSVRRKNCANCVNLLVNIKGS